MSDIRSFFGNPKDGVAPAKAAPVKAAYPLKNNTEKKRKSVDGGKEEGNAADMVAAATKKARAAAQGQPMTSLTDSDSDVMMVAPPSKGRNKSSTMTYNSPQKPQKERTNVKPSTPAKKSSAKNCSSESEATSQTGSTTPAKKKAKKSKDTPAYDPRFPWTGVTFVITGEFHELGSRDDLKDKVQRLGGRVTGGVSGKTTHLIMGHVLEDGRQPQEGSKYRKAMDINVNIIDEEAFTKMLREVEEASDKAKKITAGAPPVLSPPIVTVPQSFPNSSSSGSSINRHTDESMMLWVDKHKPVQLADLVGNNTNVTGLKNWLSTWNDVHLTKRKTVHFSRQNPGAKAALLSGPPGIGKTSAAVMVAKTLGYDIMELNASDARSKKLVSARLGDAINSASIGDKDTKRLIIMDEVDGMSSADRGGTGELILLIKKSKVPIICICNDRQKASVRTLSNHCYDLKFMRPNIETLIKRVLVIAQREGMDVEPNAVRALVQAQGGDVRQVVGALQMWKRTSSALTYDAFADRKASVIKDESFQLSNFDACGYIFNKANTESTFDLRYNAFFIDYSLLPLMIQDNYINACKSAREDDTAKLKRLSAASDACCDADLVGRAVRGSQQWNLLPQMAALNVRIASIAKGSLGFPGFPEWLGKNSSASRKRRLITETAMHMRQHTLGINAQTLRLDYLDTLRDSLLKPLLDGDTDGLNKTIETMDSYGLDRDDLFETMQDVRIGAGVGGDGAGVAGAKQWRNPFDKINSKVKAAFTRKYNKGTHKSQMLVAVEGIVGQKKTKAKKNPAAVVEVDGMGEEAEDEDSDEELDIDTIKKLGTKASKTAAKGKGKAS